MSMAVARLFKIVIGLGLTLIVAVPASGKSSTRERQSC